MEEERADATVQVNHEDSVAQVSESLNHICSQVASVLTMQNENDVEQKAESESPVHTGRDATPCGSDSQYEDVVDDVDTVEGIIERIVECKIDNNEENEDEIYEDVAEDDDDNYEDVDDDDEDELDATIPHEPEATTEKTEESAKPVTNERTPTAEKQKEQPSSKAAVMTPPKKGLFYEHDVRDDDNQESVLLL
jgi:hypothetical protein